MRWPCLLYRFSGRRFMVRLVRLSRFPTRLQSSYPPSIFLEADHGTEASKARALGNGTKSPIRPSSEPAAVRMLL